MNSQNFINKHLKQKSPLSISLLPLSLIYGLIVNFRRDIYKFFPSLSYKSNIKIISIGNITAGGSGKTPFTLFLAGFLKEQGKKVAIVLRGYKSAYENKNALISDYEKVYESVSQAGDEAALYAVNLPGTPVCVGKNRVISIKILEEKFPDLDYIIMDDAFQHLKVKQDIKFCIFNALNPVGNGFCLPAGILRESLKSLKFADYFIINGTNPSEKFLFKLKKFHKPILFGDYTISAIKDFKQNIVSLEQLKNTKNLLLSGIGFPQSFERTILKAGLSFSEHLSLADHFEYTEDYLSILKKKIIDYDYILTTEKDYSKLKHLKTDLPILVVYIKFGMESDFGMGF